MHETLRVSRIEHLKDFKNGLYRWINIVKDVTFGEFFNSFFRVVCHIVLKVDSNLISSEFKLFLNYAFFFSFCVYFHRIFYIIKFPSPISPISDCFLDPLTIKKEEHKVYWSDTQLLLNDTPYMVVNQ